MMAMNWVVSVPPECPMAASVSPVVHYVPVMVATSPGDAVATLVFLAPENSQIVTEEVECYSC